MGPVYHVIKLTQGAPARKVQYLYVQGLASLFASFLFGLLWCSPVRLPCQKLWNITSKAGSS